VEFWSAGGGQNVTVICCVGRVVFSDAQSRYGSLAYGLVKVTLVTVDCCLVASGNA